MVTDYHPLVTASSRIDTMKTRHTYRKQSKTFGDWLMRKIEGQGMNKSRFAERMGVSRTTVGRWVNGRVPEASFIDKMSDVLFEDFDYMMEKAGYRPHIEDDALEDIHARLDPLLRKMDEADIEILIDTARSLVRGAELRRSHAAKTRDAQSSKARIEADNTHQTG